MCCRQECLRRCAPACGASPACWSLASPAVPILIGICASVFCCKAWSRHSCVCACFASGACLACGCEGFPTYAVALQIEVSCQGVSGTMSVLAQHVACGCSGCARLPPSQRIMSCPQFEAHTGARWAGGGWRQQQSPIVTGTTLWTNQPTPFPLMHPRSPPYPSLPACACSNAKKWKTSLKVVPGGAPGVPASGNGMQVGRWLELNNVNFSRPVQTVGGGR